MRATINAEAIAKWRAKRAAETEKRVAVIAKFFPLESLVLVYDNMKPAARPRIFVEMRKKVEDPPL